MGARSRNVLPSLLFHGGKDHDKKGTSEPVEADEGQHLAINHDIIRNVIRKRNKLKEAYRNCCVIVDRNIQGNESIGASWF